MDASLFPSASRKSYCTELRRRGCGCGAGNFPEWVEVRRPRSEPDPGLSALGKEEQQAILLALELHADWLLMDERMGREEAEHRGLKLAGTLAVLLLAGSKYLADPIEEYRQLVAATTFRKSPALERDFLHRARFDSGQRE